MKNNTDRRGGARLRRRDWLVAAAGPALLAACGGGDPGAPAQAPTAPSAGTIAGVPMAGLAPGDLSSAFFVYLQMSAGTALNGLQALRLTGKVSGNAVKAALLDQRIASQSALLASLRAFHAAIAPLRAGTVASVVLAPAGAGTRAMVLDRAGLESMDTTIGGYLAAILGVGAPQAAHAGRPMAGVDWAQVSNFLRTQKNMLSIDNAVLAARQNPVQTVLAVAGTVAAVAAIGVVLAGSAVPAAVAGGVWAASATIGTVAAGMGIFTGLVNAAASTYGVFDAESPADRAAQWQGVLGGARQTAQGLVDGVASLAKPAQLGLQALGFANNAIKNWQLSQTTAPDMSIVLQEVTASSETVIADRIVPVDVSAPDLPGGPREGGSTASLDGGGDDGGGDDGVEAPLDASGKGRMLVPGLLAQDPGAMCVNDPLDGVLLAANELEAIAADIEILLLSPRCGFAGSYGGSFSGTDHGPVSATLSASGAVTATGSSLRFGNPIAASGSVGTSGQFLAIAGTSADGATFSGRLLSSADGWTVAGTWSNTRSGLAGTFSLSKAGCG